MINLTTKKKVMIGLSVVGIAIAGTVGTQVYSANQHKKDVSEALTVLKKETATLDKVKKELSELRDTKNPNFLSASVSVEAIEQMDKQVESLHKEHNKIDFSELKKETHDVTKQLEIIDVEKNTLEYQYKTQLDVNRLFNGKDKEAIKGTTATTDLPIIDDLTLKTIEKVATEFKNDGKTTVIPESTDDKNTWEQAIDSLIQSAEKQVNVIEDAKKEVAAMFKDKKPVETTDKKKIESLDKKINTIKNVKAKKELADQLKQVKEAVEKKTKADADKKTKEQAQDATVAANNVSVSQETNDTGNVNQDNGVADYSGSQNYDQGNQGSGQYTAPQGNSGGGSSNYTPPATNTNTNNNHSSGGNGGSVPPGYDGHATQEELDQQAVDGSTMDPSKDPNSPWYK